MQVEFMLENKQRKEQFQYLMHKRCPFVSFDSLGNPRFASTGELKKEHERIYNQCMQELKSKTDDELTSLHNDNVKSELILREKKEEQDEASRFFNKDSANTDFKYYSKFDIATLDELIALTLSKDPRIVDFESLQKYKNSNSKFFKKYSELVELVIRKFEDQIPNALYAAFDTITHKLRTKIKVIDYIQWLFEYEITEIPQEWRKQLEHKFKRRFSITGLQDQVKELKSTLSSVTSHIEGVSLTEIRNNDCYTSRMQYMLIASQQFWVAYKTGKRKDMPKNEEILLFLTEKNFSKPIAEQMIAAIRPSWAPKGRRKEE